MCTIGDLKRALKSTSPPVSLVVHAATKLAYIPADAPADVAEVKCREDAERLQKLMEGVMVGV